MKLGRLDLTQDRLVIAEIGNNHEGSLSLALEMVAAAAEAGADAVKVQVINPEKLVNRAQAERIAQLKRFKLPDSAWSEIAAQAQARGLLFIASAFDESSLALIGELVAAIKIASGDLDYGPLLIQAARLGKPMILSTGMGTLEEIRTAVDLLAVHLGSERPLPQSLALLHCVSLYPTPGEQANLRAIHTLQNVFGLTVGYSDHTLGIEAAIVALSLGARIIEKHFTLDKTRSTFRDHALSADPADLQRLATVAHTLDRMLGDGAKIPAPDEVQMAAGARRSIVAACDLPAGTCLAPEHLAYVRPRTGLPPSAAPTLLGRVLRLDLKTHDLILEQHLEK